MKKSRLIFLIIITLAISLFSKSFQPYTIGTITDKSINEIKPMIQEKLSMNGFKILGDYMPAKDSKRFVIIVTNDDLLNSVKKIEGLTGFAAAFRIAFTRDDKTKKTTISYMTPEYWGIAYFRDNFEKVSTNYSNLKKSIEKVFNDFTKHNGNGFGSEDGIESDDLEDYQYMFGMPEFDDTDELKEFDSYKTAIDKIDSNLKKGIPNLELVYSIEIPEKNLKLYGIGLGGENGEEHFLPIIDISKPKHTAFLPYEILVKDNIVHMLHGKFRIALSFPDLSMGTFMEIMSTPGDIEELMMKATE